MATLPYTFAGQIGPIPTAQLDANFAALSGAGGLVTTVIEEGPFHSGTNFTPGVTTTLPLSLAYGAPQNVSVHFDTSYKGPDTYSLVGTNIVFNAPIPTGTNTVYVIGGVVVSGNAVAASDLASTTDPTKGVALVGGAARVVASIAALRTLPKTGSPEAFVTGYYAQGDGGGGAYWYDSTDVSSADNGGSIIVASDGGRWKLSLQGGFVSTGQFGIIGASGGAAQFAACVNAAITGGIDIFVNVNATLAAVINIPTPVWTPLTIRGSADVTLNSTHNGTLFNDASGNVRFENLQLSGPGKTNTGAVGIASALGLGWVKGSKISGYYYGVDCSGSSAGLIERNHFTLNHAGVNCVKVNPLFSNIISIVRNWIDFNDYGVYIDQAYAVDIFSNTWEQNSTGAYFSGCRELTIRGANWFEASTSFAFQIVASSTGVIERNTHVVAGTENTYTIDYATCRILDLKTSKLAVVRNSTGISVPHNTETVLTWDTDVANPSAMHLTGTLPQNITIQAPGLYTIKAQMQMAAVATPGAGVVALLRVKKSGVTLREVLVPMSANVNSSLSLSFDEECANGDTIAAYGYQNQGVSVNVNGGEVSGLSVMLQTTD